MAEREGFEPPVPFRARRFSRPEPSTTRPPLRMQVASRRTRRASSRVSLKQNVDVAAWMQEAAAEADALADVNGIAEAMP